MVALGTLAPACFASENHQAEDTTVSAAAIMPTPNQWLATFGAEDRLNWPSRSGIIESSSEGRDLRWTGNGLRRCAPGR